MYGEDSGVGEMRKKKKLMQAWTCSSRSLILPWDIDKKKKKTLCAIVFALCAIYMVCICAHVFGIYIYYYINVQ